MMIFKIETLTPRNPCLLTTTKTHDFTAIQTLKINSGFN